MFLVRPNMEILIERHASSARSSNTSCPLRPVCSELMASGHQRLHSLPRPIRRPARCTAHLMITSVWMARTYGLLLHQETLQLLFTSWPVCSRGSGALQRQSEYGNRLSRLERRSFLSSTRPGRYISKVLWLH